jgi:Ca2+-transporting ATPase
MTLVLLAAALVSGLIGDLADTVVIAVIVVLNTVISAVQEWQADQALAALQRLATHDAQVRRDGQVGPVPADQLVPGDVVLLEAGDQVPADLRLHQVAQLRTDESALTGESQAVDKQPAALPTPGPGQAHALGERSNMAWKGTLVTHGRATGLVVATGAGTELGRIAGLLAQAERRSTPLQQRLTAFGRRLSTVVLGLCAVVFAIGVLRGEPVLLMGLTAISLAVAAIPEALPAVVTVLLALGARRLVRVQALVRQLPAVETLGSVTTICSDKTGTLTRNRMQVQAWRLADPADPGSPAARGRPALQRRAGPPGGLAGRTHRGGAGGVGLSRRGQPPAAPRLREWPFDAERRRMSTLTPATSAADEAPAWLWVKGAPETLLPRCTQAPVPGWPRPRPWPARACGCWPWPPPPGPADPARAGRRRRGRTRPDPAGPGGPDRPAAPRSRRRRGRMPGRRHPPGDDHRRPPRHRARHRPGGGHRGGRAGPGADRRRAGPDGRRPAGARVAEVAVYARMDPAQKIRIVQALQARGEFVAMTGDGVNDAPALKAADIGVAMGLGGTDVAREASSLVLLDDHFATIVAAVREGRRIFDNIRKFIRYALTGNSGEIWVLFLAPLLGLPVPLLPIHILWVNLVTDGLPGLALAGEPAERG